MPKNMLRYWSYCVKYSRFPFQEQPLGSGTSCFTISSRYKACCRSRRRGHLTWNPPAVYVAPAILDSWQTQASSNQAKWRLDPGQTAQGSRSPLALLLWRPWLLDSPTYTQQMVTHLQWIWDSKMSTFCLYNAKLVTDAPHTHVSAKYNVEFTNSKSCCQLVKNLTVQNLKKLFFSSSSPFGELR